MIRILIKLLPLILFCDFSTASSLSLNANINHQLSLTWMKRNKYQHSAKCYPAGKGDKTRKLKPETLVIQSNKNNNIHQ